MMATHGGATERDLAHVQAQVRRKGSTLRSAGEIGLAVGAVVNAKKMAKHFALNIGDGHFSWSRKLDQIAAEAKLDGIYVIRTSTKQHQSAPSDPGKPFDRQHKQLSLCCG